MTNEQCDICSKQVQYKFQLHTLREVYQTENIAQICEDCGSDGDVGKELKKCIDSLKECVLNLKLLDDKIKAEGFWSKIWKKLFG